MNGHKIIIIKYATVTHIVINNKKVVECYIRSSMKSVAKTGNDFLIGSI